MVEIAEREQVLRAFGADDATSAELLVYNANLFDQTIAPATLQLPLDDEPHVSVWRDYADLAAADGLWAVLRARLPQFGFPIAEGISQSEPYRAATLRGVTVEPDAGGLALERPAELRLIVYPGMAGAVPMLVPAGRRDFVALVRALTRRNEPSPVPDSMGACMVSGYNNWDRIRRQRAAWEARLGVDASDDAWREEFRRITADKALYQDRFLIISDGPYSNVPAFDMHLPDAEWGRLSLAIRTEHESVHYFTRRILSASHNNLLDEIIADYVGIVAAIGYFRADWLRLFLGLERTDGYRRGGRLENYRGDPPLSDGAFVVLQALVRAAAASLERFDRRLGAAGRDARGRAYVVLTLTRLTLEQLAAGDADAALLAAWESVQEGVAHVPS